MANQNPLYSLGIGALGAVIGVFLTLSLTGTMSQSPEIGGVIGTTEGVEKESPVVQVVERASGAVVSIVATKDVPVIEQYFEDLPNGFFSPFGFQAPQLRQRQNGTETQEVGAASGFLVSSDGLIVTNKHVVNRSDVDYSVFLSDGSKHAARVVARDPVHDIAIVKIEGSNFPALQFGSSEQLKAGQSIVVIGNPLGDFPNSVSTGVVSGLARSIVAGDSLGQSEQLKNVIQTDAAINPGNSGGPMLNLRGEVVGVNVAMAAGSENIGFALPSDLVKSVVESVQATGEIARPFLGVRYTQITPVIQEQNRLPFDYGVLVVGGEQPSELAVVPGSPADKAGLEEGNIILEIDGGRLEPEHSLAEAIQAKKVGEQVSLTVWQAGETRQITITLEKL
jgi:serine protease Do